MIARVADQPAAHAQPQPARRRSRPAGRWRPGLSLVEAALAMIILAFVAVAAARTVASARAADQLAVDREQARQLAEGMLSRILVLKYEDPSPGILGLEAGETLGLASTYDDIDDYDGYTENPVKDADGNAIAALSAWSLAVEVNWVSASDFTSKSTAETGVKRVKVTVSKSGRTILVARGYRSKGRDTAGG